MADKIEMLEVLLSDKTVKTFEDPGEIKVLSYGALRVLYAEENFIFAAGYWLSTHAYYV